MISNTASTDNLHRSDNAARPSHALRGASLAFSSPSVPAKQSTNTYSGTNGALAAASFAGSNSSSASDRHLQDLGASCSRKSHGLIVGDGTEPKSLPAPQQQRRRGFSGTSRDHSGNRTRDASREQSPSHIAAVMAASRSSPKRGQGTQSNARSDPRRPSPLHRHSDYLTAQSTRTLQIQRPTDDTHVATTNSLVELYESIQTPPASLPEACQSNKRPPIISPKPIRPSSGGRLSLQCLGSFTEPKERRAERSNTVLSNKGFSTVGAAAAAARMGKPATVRHQSTSHTKGPAPKAPPRKTTKRPALPEGRRGSTSSISAISGASSPSSYTSAVDKLVSPRKEHLAPRLKDGSNDDYKHNVSSVTQNADLRADIPASSYLMKHSPLRPVYNKSSRSFDRPLYGSARLQARLPTLSTASLVPQLTADSLANAMVASSLASSRAPSPTKPYLPPPRRHGRPHSLFPRSHSTEEVSRTPSPAKQMRQTLRTAKKSNDEEQEYRAKRSHFKRKHPNKHHEGDRKRWRDTVSEPERKRYEGVWAANKNLLHPSEEAGIPPDTVLGVIVRDIWRRSRLPDDVLEEIWNLVNTAGQGALGKEEFVVGMWLIDQRLKGRKLPVKVSESVWGSVRMLSGIKVPKHRR